MPEKLIKSKQRVKDFAEVFTPKHIVKDMCDLVPAEMWVNVDTTFLEPACGTGNFLVEILERKFKLCENWEDGLRALKSVYGVDIQQDNVEEAKGRLFEMYIKRFPKSPAISGLIAAQILENNIVCGNFIKEYTDEKRINEQKKKRKKEQKMTELEKIAKEATDHGMTYGEYVSWKARAKIEQQQNCRSAKQIAELNKKRGKKK